MTPQEVELVGGPHDGAHVAVQPGSTEYRVAMHLPPPSSVAVEQCIADPSIVVGTYCADTEADRLLGRWTWHAPSR